MQQYKWISTALILVEEARNKMLNSERFYLYAILEQSKL